MDATLLPTLKNVWPYIMNDAAYCAPVL